MDKKIIFMKIPTDEKDANSFQISPELVVRFANNVKKQLGDDYILIVSPMETTCISGDAMVIKIDTKEDTYNEPMEIIEKADNYDSLCE